MILSAAMMLRYSLDRPEQAARIENAVKKVLKSGLHTGDIWEPGCERVSTRAMGDAVLEGL
jgi:3-isopropylmalate dehydrogenase